MVNGTRVDLVEGNLPLTRPKAVIKEEHTVSDTTDRGQATRRTLLVGTGAAGLLAAGVTTACGSGSTGTPGGSTPQPSTDAGGASSAGGALGKTADIPVGGGKIFDAQKVVVTQPAAGTFKGFTAICTHKQCAVASINNGVIQCPCHGSQYSITDGSVKAGPAPAPLAEKPVTVKGDSIYLS
jgi:Rieske Fe-S protein